MTTSWADRQRLNLHADRSVARALVLPPPMEALVAESARAARTELSAEQIDRMLGALRSFEPRMSLPGGVRGRMARVAELEAELLRISNLTEELARAKADAATYAAIVLSEAVSDDARAAARKDG